MSPGVALGRPNAIEERGVNGRLVSPIFRRGDRPLQIICDRQELRRKVGDSLQRATVSAEDRTDQTPVDTAVSMAFGDPAPTPGDIGALGDKRIVKSPSPSIPNLHEAIAPEVEN